MYHVYWQTLKNQRPHTKKGWTSETWTLDYRKFRLSDGSDNYNCAGQNVAIHRLVRTNFTNIHRPLPNNRKSHSQNMYPHKSSKIWTGTRAFVQARSLSYYLTIQPISVAKIIPSYMATFVVNLQDSKARPSRCYPGALRRVYAVSLHSAKEKMPLACCTLNRFHCLQADRDCPKIRSQRERTLGLPVVVLLQWLKNLRRFRAASYNLNWFREFDNGRRRLPKWKCRICRQLFIFHRES